MFPAINNCIISIDTISKETYQDDNLIFSLDFDWELENSYTALLDLVDFQAPPVLYAGHEIELNCSVSSIYFAYGTLIYGSRDIDVTNNISHSAPFSGNLGETETWFRDGRRIVSKGIVFHTGNQTETLTCSAPLWDWSKRVEKTVQVFVDCKQMCMRFRLLDAFQT